ncbi:hypothetical protein AAFF_G00058810 [Aldrovandia affinis]|uniref:Uncharacterized protein n=1 Tax=Aldrovandia affinis TaxID=143900 RepID=A0AAD7S0F1_9TELE|nr:hypothetical protein AAFF_G00058810 [Aldrovandia affinis]
MFDRNGSGGQGQTRAESKRYRRLLFQHSRGCLRPELWRAYNRHDLHAHAAEGPTIGRCRHERGRMMKCLGARPTEEGRVRSVRPGDGRAGQRARRSLRTPALSDHGRPCRGGNLQGPRRLSFIKVPALSLDTVPA